MKLLNIMSTRICCVSYQKYKYIFNPLVNIYTSFDYDDKLIEFVISALCYK